MGDISNILGVACLFLLMILVLLFFLFLRLVFKVSYYEEGFDCHGIEDSVKNMPLYVLWLN